MEVVLWADGKAGWFKIRNPSRTYKAIYNEMVEAVNVLYFTTDLLRSKKGKKLSQLSVDTVFAKVVANALPCNIRD